MVKVAPSILSADFSRLGQEIEAVDRAGADLIHIDVMDGHFVPNITIGPLVVRAVRKTTKLPLDVHLMIYNPDLYLEEFRDAGADLITVHAEACIHLDRVVHAVKDLGIKAGVVLNPATPLTALDYVLEDVDLVLLMSVNPGFGGQKFIPGTLRKIFKLREMLKERDSKAEIEIDGGINFGTVGPVAKAGADILVAGSAVFGSGDYKKTIDSLRKASK